MKHPIKDIEIGHRIREYMDDNSLEELKESIKQNGLLNPICINQNGKLLAGERRLAACKELGWKEIEVTVIKTKGEAQELLIELHENIKRNNLTPSEEAKGLALWKQAYEKEHPETKHGAQGKGGTDRVAKIATLKNGKPALRYTKVAAKELGKSERKIQALVSKGEDILEEEARTGESETAMELDEPKVRKPRIIKEKNYYRKDKCPYCRKEIGITEYWKIVKLD